MGALAEEPSKLGYQDLLVAAWYEDKLGELLKAEDEAEEKAEDKELLKAKTDGKSETRYSRAEVVELYTRDFFKTEVAVRDVFSTADATDEFYFEYANFARNVVLAKQSIPFYRLMVYGYQASIDPIEFAGILNANALYSFTVGIVQLAISAAAVTSGDTVDGTTYSVYYISLC